MLWAVVYRHLLGTIMNRYEPALRHCIQPRDSCPSRAGAMGAYQPRKDVFLTCTALSRPNRPLDIEGQMSHRWLRDTCRGISATTCCARTAVWAALRFGVVFHRCTLYTEFNKTMTRALCIALISSGLSLWRCVVRTNYLFSSFQGMGTASARAGILSRSARGGWSLRCCSSFARHAGCQRSGLRGSPQGTPRGLGMLQVIAFTRGK